MELLRLISPFARHRRPGRRSTSTSERSVPNISESRRHTINIMPSRKRNQKQSNKTAPPPPTVTSSNVVTSPAGSGNCATANKVSNSEPRIPIGGKSASDPKKARDLPEIQDLFEKRREKYLRDPDIRVQARLADRDDIGKKSMLTSWIIDHKGNIFAETEKEFSKEEIENGMVILRYPKPLGKDENGKNIYNEWYVTRPKFENQYEGTPGMKEFIGCKTRQETRKEGIRIDEKVIEILGGHDGVAVLQPPWGGIMYAILGGLLTEEGSSLGPDVISNYYKRID